MAYKDIQKRIDRISFPYKPEYKEILQLIDKGTYYDELTEKQKDVYCDYIGINRHAMESLKDAIYISQAKDTEPYNWRHELITRKAPPIPKNKFNEHLEMRAEEIRAYMEDITDELDQEEKTKREAEWSCWSEQREAAFQSGKDWRLCPVPEWIKEKY